MNHVFIALGSNIDSEYNMLEAIRLLSWHCRVMAVSPVYETTPVGNTHQPNFLNAAALIETELTAAELKESVLQVIEEELGRVRTEDKNAPRTIDLDIALFGAHDSEAGSSASHDPDILRYAHVAVPLADIAPERHHPVTGQTLQEIARAFSANGLLSRPDVVLLPENADKPIEEKKHV